MLSSAVTNFSKKRPCAPCNQPQRLASSGAIARWPATGGGKLAHRAANGDSTHKAANGAAMGQHAGPRNSRPAPTITAKARLAAICAASPRGSNCKSSLGLRRRDPFQQAPAIDEQAEQRAAHRIHHQPRLMSKEGDQECALQKSQFEIAAQCPQVIAQRNARAPRHDAGERGQERRQRNRQKNENGPYRGGPQRAAASRSAGQKGSRRRQRTAQIVEQLPAAHQRDRRFLLTPSAALRPKPKIQGSNCQSPRTQRCWRAAATL